MKPLLAAKSQSLAKSLGLAWAVLAATPALALAATPVKHFPPGPPAANARPFSSAVQAGDTLYVSGTTDNDPATGKPPPVVKDGAVLVLNNIKRTVESAGYTMDDFVWVQVFASDLAYYNDFNEVYRTYFKPGTTLPSRAFIGAGSLLGGAHFEVMGIAVKSK